MAACHFDAGLLVGEENYGASHKFHVVAGDADCREDPKRRCDS